MWFVAAASMVQQLAFASLGVPTPMATMKQHYQVMPTPSPTKYTPTPNQMKKHYAWDHTGEHLYAKTPSAYTFAPTPPPTAPTPIDTGRCPRGAADHGGTCVACPPGKYQSHTGFEWHHVCFSCPPGKHTGAAGNYKCHACAGGTLSVSKGAKTCERCSKSEWSPPGSTACQTCDNTGPNSLRYPNKLQTACACSRGMFLDTGKCYECVWGKTASSDGLHCVPICPAGKHVIVDEICANCRPGTYQDKRGEDECIACPMGTYSYTAAQLRCVDCTFGRFQNSTHKEGCVSCPAGLSCLALARHDHILY